jgi:poly-beta-1,6-N-acetyl-D-glucosamine synthase
MPENCHSYVVITPVRNEEANLPATIRSMVNQTVLPKEWIIVDDGSSDGTAAICDEAASRYPWIKVLHRKDRGFRKAGGGVVEAFNDGLKIVTFSDWDFVVKFDGDLEFEPNYFESCLKEFELDPMLGIGGGVICYVSAEGKSFETAPRFHVRGATKIYRRACWAGLGGLIIAAGWDTMDEVKANSLGWKTRSFPDLHLIHQRDTGAADGAWSTHLKYGRANYVCGYHPLFMLCKGVTRVFKKPYIIGATGLMLGYVVAFVRNSPQVDDRQAVNYLRDQQLRLLLGRESIWR